MSKRALNATVSALVALLLAVGLQPGGAAFAQPAQSGCRAFSNTGKTVCGRFLQYWEANGGVTQQGLPISNEMQETSEVDGKTYTMQYFERAVFELHPENKAPNDVLLSLLGALSYNRKYPGGAPGQTPNTAQGSVLFSQTGKRLGGRFLQYWQQNGGLRQQGYPISDEFTEASELDGKQYRVQYFERAVFEFHPENKPPFDVLLSQLGTFEYKRRHGSGGPGGALRQGFWGGQHVSMEITADGARFEFDCARGVVSTPIAVDSAGRFEATGTFVFEGGPEPLQPEPWRNRPARYVGQLSGDTVKLTVVTTDDNKTIGPFTLTYGAQAKIFKCQ